MGNDDTTAEEVEEIEDDEPGADDKWELFGGGEVDEGTEEEEEGAEEEEDEEDEEFWEFWFDNSMQKRRPLWVTLFTWVYELTW